ncbi:hypothetical protein [Streptomyces sp. NPDC086182]|jgi:hypothetical protein|uniref:DUF6891 domain-containing protein n=1 Tax=Streptomyces sp. NPDC086182 TaxID=3155058 RepID=UPI0034430B6A
MRSDESLAIKVETENRRKHARISGGRLRELVHRIGGDDDHFLVVQRIPDVPDVFVQVWHKHGGEYQLEYREGRARFFGTVLGDRDRVADAMTGWARKDPDWDEGITWEPLGHDAPQEIPELPEDVREEVEVRIRELLACGYADRAQLAEDAEECLVSGDHRPVSKAQARELVDRLWTERLAEQEAWAGVTDPERLTEVFEALDASGITARENFACCRNCGTTEMAEERGEGARGFVYFHSQCTESVAAGYGLSLLYGGFDGSAETTAAVGREVVAALGAAGLSAQWDGSADSTIRVTGLTWHKRLVG